MNSLFEFEIRLTLRGPVLTKSTAPSTFGVDTAVARDFRTGRPCLYGTLVKGKVREALQRLGETDVDQHFGTASAPDGGFDPDRGGLVVGDLLGPPRGAEPWRRHRIAIDSDLGSVKERMLQTIETPYLPGEEAVFSGAAYCYADAPAAESIARKLRLGLCWIHQMGALRTVGFGRVLGAEVEVHPAPAPEPPKWSAPPAALEVVLRPRGPLCITRHKIGDNLFESDSVIPGNMLAGAVMETAKRLDIDIPDFAKLRFRHALPTCGGSRPRALPLSTVQAGALLYDVAGLRDPVVLADEHGEYRAPAFPIDWKTDHGAWAALGWADPARELRVRTKIDPARRTADRGDDGSAGKLFALEVVHPVTGGGQSIAWRTVVDLAQTSDPAATATALVRALSQLGFLSKTKVRCDVDVAPCTAPSTGPLTGTRLVLVLQAPALLIDPRFQGSSNAPASGALQARDLFDLYRRQWAETSDRSLNLTHYFAQQSLAGGNYLARRFQRTRPYDPWLLTSAGSVFAFDVLDGPMASARLRDWLVSGLPLPEWAKARYGAAWYENPYRPQNGFGEIAVHEPIFPTPENRPVVLAEPILP